MCNHEKRRAFVRCELFVLGRTGACALVVCVCIHWYTSVTFAHVQDMVDGDVSWVRHVIV